MNLLDFQNYVYRRAKVNLTALPLTDQVIIFNNAYQKCNRKISPWWSNYHPTLWTSADITTGTATPAFDSDYHELLGLYITLEVLNENAISVKEDIKQEIVDMEADLGRFYSGRNYQDCVLTLATPGLVTRVNHGLFCGDQIIFSTSGTLPTGLAINTYYYVVSTGYTCDAFGVSATKTGTAIAFTVSQSGQQYYSAVRNARIGSKYQNNR